MTEVDYQQVFRDLRFINDFLRAHLGKDVTIYLFGSWVLGTAHAESDYDIAIDNGGRIDWLELVRIRETLSASIKREVNLVDLQATDSKFREIVVSHAVPIEILLKAADDWEILKQH